MKKLAALVLLSAVGIAYADNNVSPPYFMLSTMANDIGSDSSLLDGSYMSSKYGVSDINAGFLFTTEKSCKWENMTVWPRMANGTKQRFNPLEFDKRNWAATITKGNVYLTFGGHPGDDKADKKTYSSYDYLEYCDGQNLYQVVKKAIDSFNNQPGRTATLAGIDFDVETGAFMEGKGWAGIGYTIDQLNKNYPKIKISLTLPPLIDDGWFKPGYQRPELSSFMHQHGQQIDHVNVMSFHYGHVNPTALLNKVDITMRNVYDVLHARGLTLPKAKYHPMVASPDVDSGVNKEAVIMIRDWNKTSGYGGISLYEMYDDVVTRKTNYYKLLNNGVAPVPTPTPTPLPVGKPGDIILNNVTAKSANIQILNHQTGAIVKQLSIANGVYQIVPKSELGSELKQFDIHYQHDDTKWYACGDQIGIGYNPEWAAAKIKITNGKGWQKFHCESQK